MARRGLRTLAVTGVLLLGVSAPVTAADDDPCGPGGPAPTIVGTSGRDVLVGTTGDDVIHGLAGNDLIRPSRGNDVVCGGPGKDTISYAGLAGGLKIDLHLGQVTGNGVDSAVADVEQAVGGKGDDHIIGTDGPNLLRGGRGADRLDGRAGGDLLRGEEGDDHLLGGDGNDVLLSGDGVDVLDGGDGNDGLVASGSGGAVHGGTGADTLGTHLTDVQVHLGQGTLGLIDGPVLYTVTGVENVDLRASRGDVVIVGDAGPNRLTGGRNGTNWLRGGAGDDHLFVEYPAAPSRVEGGPGDDTVWIDNVPMAPDEHNVIYGQGGNDLLFGSGGDDVIYGGDGDDRLYGRDGDDLLVGGPGDDYCDGDGQRTRDRARSCEVVLNVP